MKKLIGALAVSLILGGCVCLGRCDNYTLEISSLALTVPLDSNYSFYYGSDTACAVIPAQKPKFAGMVLKPIDGGPNYRWECEYGVMTGTVTIDGSYLLESVGCNPKPEPAQGITVVPMQGHLQMGDTVYHGW